MSQIKLMFVVVAVGVVAIFAIPFYGAYHNQIREQDTTVHLETIQILIKDYAALNGCYPATVEDLDYYLSFSSMQNVFDKSVPLLVDLTDSPQAGQCEYICLNDSTYCLFAWNRKANTSGDSWWIFYGISNAPAKAKQQWVDHSADKLDKLRLEALNNMIMQVW